VSVKKLEKFLRSPKNTRFADIETILLSLHWSKRQGKGSHVLFSKGVKRLTFSLHGNDCPDYQKLKAAKKISS
jgi:predicted RNA binding protein YcfA (HicA-like mRNA interferase family)